MRPHLSRLARSPALWTGAIALLASTAALGAACTTGSIGESDGKPPGSGPSGDPGTTVAADGVGKMGMRRLTRKEYDATLADLLDDGSGSGFTALPEDVRDPFDNDFTSQQASAALIDAAEALATSASQRALANTAIRAKLVSCTPTGPDDTACLTTFVKHRLADRQHRARLRERGRARPRSGRGTRTTPPTRRSAWRR